MLFILFGNPGVGKNFVGKLLRDHYQFHFYDADEDLTPAMTSAIHKREVFTQLMRDEYFEIVAKRIQELKQQHSHLVVAQALAKEFNRKHLAQLLPEAKFIFICAEDALVNERLIKRNDWVSLAYVAKIRAIFEPPELPHTVLENNSSENEIINQLSKLLREIEY